LAALYNDDGRESSKREVLTVFLTVLPTTDDKIPNNVIAIAVQLIIEWEWGNKMISANNDDFRS
jgi:hypothetical protein